ncbi:LOW QUALITY PROTEIN: xaa-Arg dipeptidase-like [Mya arenaria]|uniref:LOW QUALITY PROTEIN: xaa-Arg dipeptidase-like n=1 Tax=Mya arenaria TaxID=6604 RepID=UPI0022E70966|nr:LOW QUALITY PROTEIN: xaa-Arg dipeptidase-like [Mya arenaria]
MDDIKAIVGDVIDQNSAELNRISQSIWNNPELAFNEFHAHSELTDFLEVLGFTVEKSFNLPTAFRATYKTDNAVSGPNIAILCEYDALPGIGHACGHNLIAEVGVAAGLAVKEAMIAAQEENLTGTLTVLGCPAEEGLCGKSDLLRLGAFEGVDVALMAHPSQFNLSRPRYVSMTPLSIKYHGKASHASSHPWDGFNALDAAVQCYTNISHARQQMRPDWRVHGVIKNGGLQPNIIPDETELEYYLRTPTDPEMVTLREKVTGCIEGAALATGCTVDYKFSEKSYSNLISNNTLAEIYERNFAEVGAAIETDEERKRKFGGSTDMGNVSHVIPSLHPKFHIGSFVSNHSKDFTAVAGDSKAQKYTLDVAKALALTALDIYRDKSLLEKIKMDFEADISKQKQTMM